MNIIMLNEFEIAYDKAMLVNSQLQRSKEGFVELPEIISVVKRIANYEDIKVKFIDFSGVSKLSSVGAMLSTQEKDGIKTAENIVKNEQ